MREVGGCLFLRRGWGALPGVCINAAFISDSDRADKAYSTQSSELEVFQQENRDGFSCTDTIYSARRNRFRSTPRILIREMEG